MLSNKNIYLTGFMGCGKSTVGQILAQKLHRSFVDTDELIEAQSQRLISDIFEQDGEAAFRKLESQVIASLSQKKSLVVSLGGGAVLAFDNRMVFKNGQWVFLDVPFSVIKRRLENDQTRPLLTQGFDAAELIYKKRFPLYQLASHIISSSSESPERVCQMILQRV